MNPNGNGAELCLKINDNNNTLDLDLVPEIADYCRLGQQQAKQIINEITSAITTWKTLTAKYKIPKAEQ